MFITYCSPNVFKIGVCYNYVFYRSTYRFSNFENVATVLLRWSYLFCKELLLAISLEEFHLVWLKFHHNLTTMFLWQNHQTCWILSVYSHLVISITSECIVRRYIPWISPTLYRNIFIEYTYCSGIPCHSTVGSWS